MSSELSLAEEFVKKHTLDAARILEELSLDKIVDVIREMPPDLAAKISSLMTPHIGAEVLQEISADDAGKIIEELSLEYAAILLRRVEEKKRMAIMHTLRRDRVQSLTLLLRYPEHSAGALMDPQVFTLIDDITVKEALKHVRKNPRNVYYHIPVIDRKHRYQGSITIRKLMVSPPEAPIESVMHTGVGRISPNASRERILEHPDWRLYFDIPVVDSRSIFLGVLNYQAVRALESEIAEPGKVGGGHGAVQALGELYVLGISSFFRGVGSLLNQRKGED